MLSSFNYDQLCARIDNIVCYIIGLLTVYFDVNRKEFCELPVQAIQVHLANIKPKGQVTLV